MTHELGTDPLIRLALARGCDVYLPRITSLRSRMMRFVRVQRGRGATRARNA